MKTKLLMISAAAAALAFSGSAIAGGPPAGVPMGPPAGVPMGPPAAAAAHIPNGVPFGQPNVPQGNAASSGNTIGAGVSASAHGNAGGADVSASANNQADMNAAAELGNLNAAHASSTALAHASPNSSVGAIATYKTAMENALALTDPTAQTDAITAARVQLASTSNKQLTPDAVTKIDAMLGITGADPTLGTTP